MGGLPKKKCVMEGASTQGGGPAESHREYYVGVQLVREELDTRHTARSEATRRARGRACQLDPGELGGGNGEMDEGSEGRSGVTLGGSTAPCGENPGQSPLCVAHGVPPALPRERL